MWIVDMVLDKFLKENPDYEVFKNAPSIDFNQSQILMTKNGFYVTRNVGYDYINTLSRLEIVDLAAFLLEDMKKQIDKMIEAKDGNIQ